MPDLKTILTEVAETIAKRAKEDAVPFAEATDALKALTALYTAFRKHPDDDGEADEGFDFSKGIRTAAVGASLSPQDQINGTASTRVHSRRRPSGAIAGTSATVPGQN